MDTIRKKNPTVCILRMNWTRKGSVREELPHPEGFSGGFCRS
jgi:hypothetical protein